MRLLDLLPLNQFLSLTAARWKPYRCETCGNMIGKDMPHKLGCTVDPTLEGPLKAARSKAPPSFKTYLILYIVFLVTAAVAGFLILRWM